MKDLPFPRRHPASVRQEPNDQGRADLVRATLGYARKSPSNACPSCVSIGQRGVTGTDATARYPAQRQEAQAVEFVASNLLYTSGHRFASVPRRYFARPVPVERPGTGFGCIGVRLFCQPASSMATTMPSWAAIMPGMGSIASVSATSSVR